MQTQAPGVQLRFLAEAHADTSDLRQGRVDLGLGSAEPQLPDLHFQILGYDQLVVACRTAHPYALEPTLARFVRAPQLIVSRRCRLTDPLGEALAARGQQRRVVSAVPISTAALHFAAQSELLVVVPLAFCLPVVRWLGLQTAPIPFELAPIPLFQSWHRRYDGDPAHLWLRAQVYGLVGEMEGLKGAVHE